jgi:hypothetical protein
MTITATLGYLWLGSAGQIVLQTETYSHSYDDAKQAAKDIAELLKSGTTDGWAGNDEDGRIDLDDDELDECGNSLIVIASADTAESLADEIRRENSGHAASDLAEALHGPYHVEASMSRGGQVVDNSQAEVLGDAHGAAYATEAEAIAACDAAQDGIDEAIKSGDLDASTVASVYGPSGQVYSAR